MARIVIKESDLTTPIVATNSSEIVYIPGFGTNEQAYLSPATAVAKGTPTLCRTVAEFNAYFGAIPAVFASEQPYPSAFSDDAKNLAGSMFKSGDVDPSYIYAKELINAGVAVLYERLNKTPYEDPENFPQGEQPTVDIFYERLVGTEEYDPLGNLDNINDFNIKYITTGGYPAFEYGYTLAATAEGGTLVEEGTPGIDMDSVEVNSKTFIDNAFGESAPEESEFSFIYNTVVNYNVGDPTVSPDKGISDVTVDSQTLITMVSPTEATTYTFTATVSEQVVTWALNGVAVGNSIDNYGISFTGTPLDGASIAIVVTPSSVETWTQQGVAVDIASFGITYAGTAKLNDYITVVVAVANRTSIVAKMLDVASKRGDCVAIIDHTNNKNRTLLAKSEHSVYWAASNTESKYRIVSNGAFGAMFTPWYVPTFVTSSKPSANITINGVSANDVEWEPSSMPPSFAYLMALAYSVRNNPSWLAIAGIARGTVPNFVQLNLATRLTNAIADSYQQDDNISINPITNIRPYGYTIWGNRTLKDNAKAQGLTATSFLNIRNMVSDIKKSTYSAAVSCLFEQNTDILWLNFKAQIEPLLEQMTSGYGINNYKIIREVSNDPSKIIATIRIYPVYAVESFEITVELSNDTINVAE